MSERAPHLVSLTGVGARVFIWLYFAATAALALWTLPDSTQPVLVLVVLALYAGAVIAVSLDRRDRLGLPAALVLVGVAPLSVVLLLWNLVPGGYTSWFIGGATAMLFFANLRGRIALAWIGCALMVGALMLWAVVMGADVVAILLTATRQSAIVAVGTLTALALQRTGGRIGELAADASVRGTAEAAQLAITEERTERIEELRTSVVPLLQRIADGAPISAEDRSAFAVAEADLRDSLRARALRTPRVMAAASTARRRGVDVVLLDDSAGEITGAEIAAFETVVVDALTTARDGRVIARLLPPKRALLGTVVVDGSTHTSHEVVRGG